MVDVIYNVLTRPLATDPDKKDLYHVDPAPKDAKIKSAEDDDAKEGKEQHQKFATYLEMEEEKKDEVMDKKLEPEQKGKGKFIDKDGKEHLDFFV